MAARKSKKVVAKKVTRKNNSSNALFTKHPNLTWLLPFFVLAVVVYIFLLYNSGY